VSQITNRIDSGLTGLFRTIYNGPFICAVDCREDDRLANTQQQGCTYGRTLSCSRWFSRWCPPPGPM